MTTSERNPDAVLDGQDPESRQAPVGGTTLYVEEQGSGAALLLIGAADEDAELYRGIADRLATECRVVACDGVAPGEVRGRDGRPTRLAMPATPLT